MECIEKTCGSISQHFRIYPHMQIMDLFKFLYQSSFGCEHMVTDPEGIVQYVRDEADGLQRRDYAPVIPLDGEYSRVDLGILAEGLSAESLGRLFYLSAKKEENGAVLLQEKLIAAEKLIIDGVLPFDRAEYQKEVKKWEEKGFSPVHHSELFRSVYKPAYRVISNRFIPFLQLFAKIDGLMAKKNTVRLAVEGGSASGKSTLAEMIQSLYSCTVFHMDDFFLRPEQRTAERFAEPGGNVDRERFLSEVLQPLSMGECAKYCVFDCASFALMPPVTVKPKQLSVIEGAYSMHPDLEKYYDFSVFLDVSPELQKSRIIKRNTPELTERFFREWIPMEQLYFDVLNVKERCNIVIPIKSSQ